MCSTSNLDARPMLNRPIADRRDFLAGCLAGAAAFALDERAVLPQNMATPSSPLTTSRVSLAEDAMLRGSGSSVASGRMAALLDRALQALFQTDSPIHAWENVVHPGQLIALKVNTLGGRGLSTSIGLVDAICERLQQAGIRARDIVIFDRNTAEMERAGFRIRTGGDQVQCFGTDRLGYEDDLAVFGEVGSRLSRILTRRCEVLINIPVLKDHDGAGVSIALKNMYGVIHNPNKYHPNGCNPYVADVNMLPDIRAKLRLHICDATTACFDGGPGFKPQFTWQQNALIVSTDPVALDQAGWQLIERKRAEKGLKTLAAEGREPRYIATGRRRTAPPGSQRLATHCPGHNRFT
jgi:uncharacterized protein (DUF362 family)